MIDNRIIIEKVANGYVLAPYLRQGIAMPDDSTYVFNDLADLFDFIKENFEPK